MTAGGGSLRSVRWAGALLAALVLLFGVGASVASAATPPQLSVTGASLTVASTGQRLYGVNADRRLLIASTTKLMTALVVLQHVKNLSEVFTAPNWYASSVDSQIGLVPGERMTVKDLLTALLLPSADDAAYDLAYNVGGGSVSRFVGEMNADAVQLGLTNTHYENPIGLDSPTNYSSADDLNRLAAYLMANYPVFAQTVRLRSATLTSGNEIRHVTNTDTLLGAEPWITGVKTGHTNAAGYILVSSGTRHGLTLIASVLGTSSEAARNANALALLDYGFTEWHLVVGIRKGEVIRRLPVSGVGVAGVVIAATRWAGVVAHGQRVTYGTRLPQKLNGPLRAGTRVGVERVFIGGRLVATVPLVLGRAVPAEATLAKVAHLFGGTTTLGLLALMFGVLITARELRRVRSRPAPRRRAELEAR